MGKLSITCGDSLHVQNWVTSQERVVRLNLSSVRPIRHKNDVKNSTTTIISLNPIVGTLCRLSSLITRRYGLHAPILSTIKERVVSPRWHKNDV